MEVLIMATKPGLYANINAKRERIAAGSKEKMRQPGAKGAPTAKDFKDFSLDFIYIDGRHDYTGVKEDLEAWWLKLKNG